MAKWKYFQKAEFIWNGIWNDPQLEYKGKLYNLHLIEETMWDRFNDYASEEGVEINDENFTTYCLENEYEIEELFELVDE